MIRETSGGNDKNKSERHKKPTAHVRFRIHDPTGTIPGETLWAYDLGKDRYKLANIPIFVSGVSVHDIVLAPYDKKSGFPTFKRTIIKSGNRTLWIDFNMRVNEGNESDLILNKLLDMGCGCEGVEGLLFSLNIPPTTSLHAVVEYLERVGIQWELADPDVVSCSYRA